LLVVAVDGVLIDGKLDNYIDTRNGMGSWRKSYEGEAIVVHSGLNCIDGKFGEGDFSLSLADLKELFASDPEANNWTIHKPSVKTLGQAQNEKNYDIIGDIVPVSKTIFLDEFKRDYARKPKTATDLLTKVYKGKAWDIGLLQAVVGMIDDNEEEGEENG
jgi:hypothetical protein